MGQELIVKDPTRDIDYCRAPNRLPKSILTPDEMQRLLRAPDPSSAVGYRDRMSLELLYSTGLRVSELCGLDVTDVDTSRGYVHVRLGKGGKDRVVPVGRLACELVDNYLLAIRPVLLDGAIDQSALLLAKTGKRLGRSGIAGVIRRAVEKAKLSKHVTPHTFRHSCATHMLRGADLKEAHTRFHPRGSLLDEDSRPAATGATG